MLCNEVASPHCTNQQHYMLKLTGAQYYTLSSLYYLYHRSSFNYSCHSPGSEDVHSLVVYMKMVHYWLKKLECKYQLYNK